MRSSRLAAAALVFVSVSSMLASLSCAPATQQPTADSAPDPVARGRYLTTIMSCGDCHTPGTLYGAPDTTRRLSGSELGWAGPWGVAHARNLTPDSTGLGSWTAEQIAHALRTGNTPDGRQLAPIMPWMNYANVLTEEDALAIAAYLKSLPAVSHANLPLVPPDQKASGAVLTFPPPPAWDVPPPPAGSTP